MRLLALDFDGVISNSARESLVVALRSYLDLRPGSRLRDVPSDDLVPAFRELMPLGNRAEDYGTTMAAIDEGRVLPDQERYNEYREAQDSRWLERYHRRFYEVRHAMADRDPEGWRGLMGPYRPLLEVLRRRAGDAVYAIATAKDGRSVATLLDSYGIADLFPAHLILDKETGARKTAHLTRLHELLGVDYAAMTFVDDKVSHLDSVASLGVRCALAAWGFNGRREHELAARRGYLVCTLDDVEHQLFSKGDRSI